MNDYTHVICGICYSFCEQYWGYGTIEPLGHDPGLTDELLDRHQCMISHVRVLMRHELHDARLPTQLSDPPKPRIKQGRT